MYKHLLFSVLLTLSAFAGSLLALHHEGKALAGTERLRWMAATYAGSWPNQEYCTGEGPNDIMWHSEDGESAGYALDVFADSADPCGGSSAASVWASSLGTTSVYGDYYLVGNAYDYTSPPCESVLIQVLWWNGGWTAIGYEWLEHVDAYSFTEGHTYAIWISEDDWTGSNSYWYVGQERDPETDAGCAGVGFHVHQTILEGFMSVDVSINGDLDPDQDYPTGHEDDYPYFVHEWTGWAE